MILKVIVDRAFKTTYLAIQAQIYEFRGTETYEELKNAITNILGEPHQTYRSKETAGLYPEIESVSWDVTLAEHAEVYNALKGLIEKATCLC